MENKEVVTVRSRDDIVKWCKDHNIKVGDLLNWWGHIAMLIGIDGDTYYVAESLSYIGGVRAMIYSKNELLKTFEYVVLMDKFYKNDGNYQKFW